MEVIVDLRLRATDEYLLLLLFPPRSLPVPKSLASFNCCVFCCRCVRPGCHCCRLCNCCSCCCYRRYQYFCCYLYHRCRCATVNVQPLLPTIAAATLSGGSLPQLSLLSPLQRQSAQCIKDCAAADDGPGRPHSVDSQNEDARDDKQIQINTYVTRLLCNDDYRYVDTALCTAGSLPLLHWLAVCSREDITQRLLYR